MLDSGSANFINGMIGIANGNQQLAQFKAAGNKLNAVSQYQNQGKQDQAKSLQQFEGMFLGQLMRLMFDTVKIDEMFGGGFAEETYRGMMADEYGMTIAQNGGIGVADSLQKSMFDFKNIGNESRQTIMTADAAANAYTKLYNF